MVRKISLRTNEILAQELIAPPNEPNQCEEEVELFHLSPDCPIKSFIDIELIDFIGVEKFKLVCSLSTWLTISKLI